MGRNFQTRPHPQAPPSFHAKTKQWVEPGNKAKITQLLVHWRVLLTSVRYSTAVANNSLSVILY